MQVVTFTLRQSSSAAHNGHDAGRNGVGSRLRDNGLTFRHRASCILGQAFRYPPENAFYIPNQQIYFII